jgi:hypothetical protein
VVHFLHHHRHAQQWNFRKWSKNIHLMLILPRNIVWRLEFRSRW